MGSPFPRAGSLSRPAHVSTRSGLAAAFHWSWGGSPFYLHALCYGLADIPEVPAAIRRRVQRELQELGPEALYQRLFQVDPHLAATMDPTKTQRLTRALEVHEATGRSLSGFYSEQTPSSHTFQGVVLYRERRRLYDRIDQRVERMLARGLLDEVRGLVDARHDFSAPPLRTIGYQEPAAFLRNEISEEEMVRLIQRNTRRYAKRQLTWLRRYRKFVRVDAEQGPKQMLREVLDAFA